VRILLSICGTADGSGWQLEVPALMEYCTRRRANGD